MRYAHLGLVGIGGVLCLLLAQMGHGIAAESALEDPRFQRVMPHEPGGLANPLPGRSGGGGLGLGGRGGGAGSGGAESNDGADTSTDRASRAQDNTARADPSPPPPRPRRADDGPPPNMTAIGKTVLWILLAVVIAFLVFWLFLLFRRIRFGFKWRRNKPPAEPKQETTATESVTELITPRSNDSPTMPARPLTDWERLAQAGDYGAAVRIMLRHAVAKVRQSTGSTISPNLTSREIVRVVRATPQAAKPLRTIVRAVEFVHFAGRPATVKHYEACVASLAQIEQRETAS